MKLMLTQLLTKLELKLKLKLSWAKTYRQTVGFSDVTILVMTVGISAGTITKNLLPNQNLTGC